MKYLILLLPLLFASCVSEEAQDLTEAYMQARSEGSPGGELITPEEAADLTLRIKAAQESGVDLEYLLGTGAGTGALGLLAGWLAARKKKDAE